MSTALGSSPGGDPEDARFEAELWDLPVRVRHGAVRNAIERADGSRGANPITRPRTLRVGELSRWFSKKRNRHTMLFSTGRDDLCRAPIPRLNCAFKTQPSLIILQYTNAKDLSIDRWADPSIH